MKKGGFSLALTLWIVAILSLLSILYLDYGRKVVLKSKQLQTKLELILENESAIELIKFYGATGNFIENRIENSLLKSIIKTIPPKIYLNSSKIGWKNSIISLQDSAGLIDIQDTSTIATCLVENRDRQTIIEDSILDWYDKDDLSHLNGAESDFYIKEGVKYTPRNRQYISTLEELLLIRGLKDLSKKEQDRLISDVVIADYVGYNIYTLKDDILKCKYNLTNGDIEQLKKIKKLGNLGEFISLFYSLSKKPMDMEMDSFFPSHIVKVKIITSLKNIRKEVELLIEFNADMNKAFEVLSYKN